MGRSFTVAEGFFSLRKGDLAIPFASLGDIVSGSDAEVWKVEVFLPVFAWLLPAAPVDSWGQTRLVVIRVMLLFSDALEEQVSSDGL